MDQTLHFYCESLPDYRWHVSGVSPTRPLSLPRLLILTDTGLPVFVQTETPAAETLKGTRTVLACVITTAVSSQTLVYI